MSNSKTTSSGGPPKRPVYIAITTPFDASGKLIPSALTRHLAFLSERRIDQILIGGTTGEGIRMASGQRIALLRAARPAFPGKLAFNVSSASLAESIALAQQAEMAGADELIFTLPPSSRGAPPTGLFDFVSKLISSTPEAKFWLYLHPSVELDRHQINDLLAHIADHHPNIIGMKDSSADLSVAQYCRRIMRVQGRDFKILTGRDSLVETAMEEKLCDGVVSGGCNPFPELMLRLVAALEQNQIEEVARIRELQQQWITAISAHYRFSVWAYGTQEIAAIKLALNKVLEGGYPLNVLPPLCASLEPGNIEAILGAAEGLSRQIA